MPNLITEGGEGLEIDKKWLRNMWTAPNGSYQTRFAREITEVTIYYIT